MPVFSFHTIQQPAEGLYKDKGSKFLAFAYPVEREEDIKLHIEGLKKKYFDARHHCFAYVLGADKKKFRAFDDGEPNHSAGDPILGQIRSKDITNVLVVVVRYFGGVKLGVGGLISAYKAAAEDALSKAILVEREVTEYLQLTYDYAATPEIMRLVKDYELRMTGQEFNDASSRVVVEYKLRDKEQLLDKVRLLQAMGVKVSCTFEV